MSYSNRPSQRPDPTIAPVIRNPVTGQLELRAPWTPSAYQEQKHIRSKEARERNRQIRR